MSVPILPLLTVIVVSGGLLVVFVLVLVRIRRVFAGSRAGWIALERVWGVDAGPSAPIAVGVSLIVGRTLWRNCVAIGVEPGGLRLAVRVPLLGGFGRRPVLLPWTAFHGPEPATLFFGTADLYRLGSPEVATITLPAPLVAAIRTAGGALPIHHGLEPAA